MCNDKTKPKKDCAPSIRIVWPVFVVRSVDNKGPKFFFHADSEDSDQIERKP